MNRRRAWLILAVVVVTMGTGAYFGLKRVQPPVHQLEVRTAERTEPRRQSLQERATPRIRYPVVPHEHRGSKSKDGEVALWGAVIDLIGDRSLRSLLQKKDFVRRIVGTVDCLPRRRLPPRLIPLEPARGHLQVIGQGNYASLSPTNYSRYEPYVRLMQSVTTHDLITVYVRHYSLFQQAYSALGYGKWYFNDRVVEAIDDLLATPSLADLPWLDRPNVRYLLQDPELEALSVGQKIMIRIGPLNAAKVKGRLREIRKELVNQ